MFEVLDSSYYWVCNSFAGAVAGSIGAVAGSIGAEAELFVHSSCFERQVGSSFALVELGIDFDRMDAVWSEVEHRQVPPVELV